MSKKKRRRKLSVDPKTLVSTVDPVGPLVGPEFKAMESKGYPLAEKLTLEQYNRLIRRGYDGDVVRKWTRYHAAKVLGELRPTILPRKAVSPRTPVSSNGSVSQVVPKTVVAPENSPLTPGTIAKAVDLIGISNKKIGSRPVLMNGNGSVTVLAFEANQEHTEQASPHQVCWLVLEGQFNISVFGKSAWLRQGEMMTIPAHNPYRIRAISRSKLLVTKIKT